MFSPHHAKKKRISLAATAVREHLLVLAILSATGLSVHLAGIGLTNAAIGVLSAVSIGSFYYNMVHLYGQCDRYMGCVPSARMYYFAGFPVVSAGIAAIAVGFALSLPVVGWCGIVSLLVGLGVLLYATKNLFDRIIRSGIA